MRVQLETPDGPVKEIGVPVDIRMERPVWVAKQPIRVGQRLSVADFELHTREVAPHETHLADATAFPVGYAARVSIQAGEALDLRKLTLLPDIRCNDAVQIILKSGGMTVSAPGVALGSARIGETIRVRQSRFQHRCYTARVIDKTSVLVEL